MCPWIASAWLMACASSPSSVYSSRAPLPGTPEPTDTAAANVDEEASTVAFLAAIAAQDRAVNESAWRCWSEAHCIDGESRVVEDTSEYLRFARQTLRNDVLASRRGAGLPLRARRAARAILEHATAQTTAEADRREQELLLHDPGGMPFVPGDLPALLAAAASPTRLTLLTRALPIVEERRLRLASTTSQREAAALAAGLTPDQLLAARAGLDGDALRALVEDVLHGTRPLLQKTPTSVADLPELLATLEAVQEPPGSPPGEFLRNFVPVRVQRHGKAPGCAVVDPPQDVRLLEAAAAPRSLASYARAYCGAAARLREGAWDPLWLHTVAQLFSSVTANPAADTGVAAAHFRRRAAYLLTLRGYAVEIAVLLRTSPPESAVELDALVATWGGAAAEHVVGASALLALDVSGLAVDLLVAEVVSAAIENTFVARFGADWARQPQASKAVEQELALLSSAWLRGGALATLQALGLSQLDASPLLRRWERL